MRPDAVGFLSRKANWEEALATICLMLILATSYAAYAPGIEGGLVLDDHSSIAPILALPNDGYYILQIIEAENAGPIGRPLSALTFALDHVYGRGMQGLKRTSILLHLICTVLVCWLLIVLLRVREIKGAAIASVVCAGVWSLSTQHTSTVLYVVQRMAILSAVFCLIAMIAYVKARVAMTTLGRVLWLLIAVLACGLAAASKESGFLAMVFILLLEACWFADRQKQGRLNLISRISRVAVWCSPVVLALAIWWGFDWISRGYEVRQFSLLERLITQPVVIATYTAQFLWSDLQWLGVFHDDYPIPSHESLWSFSGLGLVLLLLLLGAVLFCSRKRSWCAFPIFLFFAAHSMESSILALEIYFDHRNYLPSVAIVLSLAILVSLAGSVSKGFFAGVVALLTCFIFVSALRTSVQSTVWSNEELLALHHLAGHPGSARANIEMASRLANNGDADAAFLYSSAAFEHAQLNKSARSERAGDYLIREAVLACSANISFPQSFAERFEKLDSARPIENAAAISMLAEMYMSSACERFNWRDFGSIIGNVYFGSKNAKVSGPTLVLKRFAVLFDLLGNPATALKFINLGLHEQANSVEFLAIGLDVAARNGFVERADFFFTELESQARQGNSEAESLLELLDVD